MDVCDEPVRKSGFPGRDGGAHRIAQASHVVGAAPHAVVDRVALAEKAEDFVVVALGQPDRGKGDQAGRSRGQQRGSAAALLRPGGQRGRVGHAPAQRE